MHICPNMECSTLTSTIVEQTHAAAATSHTDSIIDFVVICG